MRALIVAGVMCLTLAGCAGSDGGDGETVKSSDKSGLTEKQASDPSASAEPEYDAESATPTEQYDEFVRLAEQASMPHFTWPLDNAEDGAATADVICQTPGKYATNQHSIFGSRGSYADYEVSDLLFTDAYCPEVRPELTAAQAKADKPKPHRVVPADFKIKIKIREKQCFGSAGCNITFQISPVYQRELKELNNRTLDVTYVVQGGEDGPQINTFTLDDKQISYDGEEFTSTSSSSSVLTAKVTRVEKGSGF